MTDSSDQTIMPFNPKQKKETPVAIAKKEEPIFENIEELVDKSRNRKRGRGKIKINKRQHVNNKELLIELVAFKKSAEEDPEKIGRASERLGEMFLDLVENFATKTNFSGYTYLEEMKSRAIFFLLRYSKSFNPEKSKNAFAYCTQIVKNAFIQVIKKEKKRSESKKQYVEDFIRNRDFNKKEDDLYFGK